jgi:hypothetical protein
MKDVKIVSVSLPERNFRVILEKAEQLGLSFSAFVRLAAMEYEVRGAPSSPKSEAPAAPRGDAND